MTVTMWYDLRHMRVLFYAGASVALIGLGIVIMGFNLEGALTMCLGAALLIIGMTGISLNLTVASRQRRSSSKR